VVESIRGASADAIRVTLSNGEALPGLGGFAGRLPDGRLVRDALGREPLYVDGEAWAWDPRELDEPSVFPAGSAGSLGEEPRAVLSVPPSRERAPTEAANSLESALDDALSRIPDGTPVGFSGGVDSAVVATATADVGYVVGLPDAPDVEAARDGAAAMGLDLQVVELDLPAIEAAVPPVARAIALSDPMDVGIAVGLYLLGRAVSADGHDRVALGQGADELFAGYQKVAQAPTDDRLSAQTVRGARDEMLGTIPHQAARDVSALRAAGVEPVMPFLADGVVEAALELPASMLVCDGTRKACLRDIARDRLPARLADREKTAMQYGSRIAREIDRLAREAGFKRREPDHVRRYIEARLQEA
jgi:asparagine synthase (glutamine-hydrolysing)